MQTALILMTILGCDDTATQCHYIEMLDRRWATIEACDASSENTLMRYANHPYPVMVAVCQTPEETGLPEFAAEAGITPPFDPVTAGSGPSGAGAAPVVDLPKADIPDPFPSSAAGEAEARASIEAGIASRVLARFKKAMPEAQSVKALVAEPVHVVTDSYAWVARRFEK